MRRSLMFLLLTTWLWAPCLAQEPDWRTPLKAAVQLRGMEQYQEALVMARRALESAKAGSDRLAVGPTSNAVGLLLQDLGKYQEALAYFSEAHARYEADTRLGPEHEMTAKVYKNKGLCYGHLGRPDEAELWLAKALHNYELLDPNHGHPDTQDIVQGVADALYQQARYDQAEALYRELVSKTEGETLASRLAREGLAGVFVERGDAQAALDLLKPLEKFYKKKFSTDNYDRLTRIWGKLAQAHHAREDYSLAERYYKKTLVAEESDSADHPDLATAVSNLAGFYSDIGDLESAEKLFQRALKIHETLLGPDHPLTGVSLNNLAVLYSSKKDYPLAEDFLLRALEVSRKAHGTEPKTAVALSNLGTLYLQTERAKQAVPLFEEAVEIFSSNPGPDLATTLGNLASAFHHTGEHKKAERYFQQALQMGDSSTQAVVNNNLSYLSIDQGDRKKALSYARKAADHQFARLQSIFSFTSERQRLAFKRELVVYGLFATLESPRDLLQTALRFKGAVLDSIVEEQRLAEASADSEVQELLSQLKKSKAKLLQLELRGGKPAELTQVTASLEEAESLLARRVTTLSRGRQTFKVTIEQVQKELPEGTVLVEFLHHGYYFGHHKDEKRYGAVLLAAKGEPKWVPLGSAKELREILNDYRQLVAGSSLKSRAGRVFSAPNQTTSVRLESLYEKIWAPIEEAMPKGTSTLVLSPDGDLNFLSFATLVTPEKLFLGERYQIFYASSGRDLITEVQNTKNQESVLFGAPKYRVTEGKTSKTSEISLAPLPGTEIECRTLHSKLGEQAVLNLDVEAKESALQAVRSPRILHIATHGFFLGENAGPKSPMARACLAFTGAQDTLNAWAAGEAPDSKTDGVLTAKEVGVMELSGTNLVVLSACDTGLGASEKGEGVIGLRRGFVQSGTQHLLFTLWPVDDDETAEFMTQFYSALKELGPRSAFAKTQSQWLRDLREKQGLVRAAKLAGPFVLSVQGGLK